MEQSALTLIEFDDLALLTAAMAHLRLSGHSGLSKEARPHANHVCNVLRQEMLRRLRDRRLNSGTDPGVK